MQVILKYILIFFAASFVGWLWEWIIPNGTIHYDTFMSATCHYSIGLFWNLSNFCNRLPFLSLYGFCAGLTVMLTDYLGAGWMSTLLCTCITSFWECTFGWIGVHIFQQYDLWCYPDHWFPLCDKKISLLTSCIWAIFIRIYQWLVTEHR